MTNIKVRTANKVYETFGNQWFIERFCSLQTSSQLNSEELRNRQQKYTAIR